jgi:hypothetical protein
MTWNTNMEDAPKGATETRAYTHWKSNKPYDIDHTSKKPILLSVSGQTIQSFWSELRGTWSGISKEEVPDAWMAWPEPYVKQEKEF